VIAVSLTASQLDEAAAEARVLREWLRPIVAAWAGDAEGATGAALPARARSHLNDILATDCRHVQLDELADGSFVLSSRRRWSDPRQLLIPPAEAAAQLFANGDPRLVRICEGPSCMLWFYDHTKAHRRRWCSMAVCGNRAKVRSHRDRSRELPASNPDAE
jgi:predicted RNA-binding Zn ribbon-like protein